MGGGAPRGERAGGRGLPAVVGAAVGAVAAVWALSRPRGRGGDRGGRAGGQAGSVRGQLPPLLGELPELPPGAEPCATCAGTGKVACFSCQGAGALTPTPMLPPPPLTQLYAPPLFHVGGRVRGVVAQIPMPVGICGLRSIGPRRRRCRRTREWSRGPRAARRGVAGVVRGLPRRGRCRLCPLQWGRAPASSHRFPASTPGGRLTRATCAAGMGSGGLGSERDGRGALGGGGRVRKYKPCHSIKCIVCTLYQASSSCTCASLRLTRNRRGAHQLDGQKVAGATPLPRQRLRIRFRLGNRRDCPQFS